MEPFDSDFGRWLDPIDARKTPMQRDLIELAAINSGSDNLTGVNRVGRVMARHLAALQPAVERHTLKPVEHVADDGTTSRRVLADARSFRKRPQAPVQVLLGGHLDTVYPADHPFQQVTHTDDGGRLNGPGVADLKGGLIVMLAALAALEASPWREHIGWEVLLNPDEEIGSPGSAGLLAQAAKRHDFGLVYEPSMPDGGLAGARKGSGNFTLVARGRAAHAGRAHHRGRNALRALADALAAIDDLNGQRAGLTVNPAFVHGGGPSNVVPDTGVLRFNVRVARADDQAWFEHELAAIIDRGNARDGLGLERHGGFTRPPKELTPANDALFELLADCGARLHQDIAWHATGGCCDGNNLAAAGLPNIDTLGVIGGAIHSSDEYVELDSLVPRARLSALLLMRLAAGELAPAR